MMLPVQSKNLFIILKIESPDTINRHRLDFNRKNYRYLRNAA